MPKPAEQACPGNGMRPETRGASQFSWHCGGGATIPAIEEVEPTVAFDVEFDGRQGAGTRFDRRRSTRPIAWDTSKAAPENDAGRRRQPQEGSGRSAEAFRTQSMN